MRRRSLSFRWKSVPFAGGSGANRGARAHMFRAQLDRPDRIGLVDRFASPGPLSDRRRRRRVVTNEGLAHDSLLDDY